ncbi:MAG: DUF1266 domain-containing protein [Geobacteraceae bacterium]|nr:DUF1266 domain-containing protein [Geobacteraceae bacterium]
MIAPVSLPLTIKYSNNILLMSSPVILSFTLISVLLTILGTQYDSAFAFIPGCVTFGMLYLFMNCIRTVLTLHDHGFVIKNKVKTIEVKWADINMVAPFTFAGMKCTIAWFYTEEYKSKKMGKISRALSAESIPDRRMHGVYRGYSTAQLADLMNRIRMAAQPAPPISPEQKFALATSAILTEVNCLRHDMLHGDIPSYSLSALSKDILSSFWGVCSEIELNESLSWLKKHGDRKNYEELAAHLKDMGSLSDPLQLLTPEAVAGMSKKEKEDFKREAFCVQNHMQRHKSILAWDYCRLVSVARFGAAAKFQADDEAWQWIMDAAATLKYAFSSWQEMADNYLVGREFAAIDHGSSEVNISVKKLLDRNNPSSPWNTIPWDSTPKVYGIECDLSTLSHHEGLTNFWETRPAGDRP